MKLSEVDAVVDQAVSNCLEGRFIKIKINRTVMGTMRRDSTQVSGQLTMTDSQKARFSDSLKEIIKAEFKKQLPDDSKDLDVTSDKAKGIIDSAIKGSLKRALNDRQQGRYNINLQDNRAFADLSRDLSGSLTEAAMEISTSPMPSPRAGAAAVVTVTPRARSEYGGLSKIWAQGEAKFGEGEMSPQDARAARRERHELRQKIYKGQALYLPDNEKHANLLPPDVRQRFAARTEVLMAHVASGAITIDTDGVITDAKVADLLRAMPQQSSSSAASTSAVYDIPPQQAAADAIATRMPMDEATRQQQDETNAVYAASQAAVDPEYDLAQAPTSHYGPPPKAPDAQPPQAHDADEHYGPPPKAPSQQPSAVALQSNGSPSPSSASTGEFLRSKTKLSALPITKTSEKVFGDGASSSTPRTSTPRRRKLLDVTPDPGDKKDRAARTSKGAPSLEAPIDEKVLDAEAKAVSSASTSGSDDDPLKDVKAAAQKVKDAQEPKEPNADDRAADNTETNTDGLSGKNDDVTYGPGNRM